jgi:hypothetical protein
MTGSERAFASHYQHFRLESENLRGRTAAFAKRGLTGCLIGGGCGKVDEDIAANAAVGRLTSDPSEQCEDSMFSSLPYLDPDRLLKRKLQIIPL